MISIDNEYADQTCTTVDFPVSAGNTSSVQLIQDQILSPQEEKRRLLLEKALRLQLAMSRASEAKEVPVRRAPRDLFSF